MASIDLNESAYPNYFKMQHNSATVYVNEMWQCGIKTYLVQLSKLRSSWNIKILFWHWITYCICMMLLYIFLSLLCLFKLAFMYFIFQIFILIFIFWYSHISTYISRIHIFRHISGMVWTMLVHSFFFNEIMTFMTSNKTILALVHFSGPWENILTIWQYLKKLYHNKSKIGQT